MQDHKRLKLAPTAALAMLAAFAAAPAAVAHDSSSATAPAMAPPAAEVLQLDEVRHAVARYLDEDAAFADGYVDVGVFFPNMGWHYLKPELMDANFEHTAPEFLVYADDPCGGKRRLVAVEYAVPLELSKKAPAGFAGSADRWTRNTNFGLWTLHAWVHEYNPDGVFAPDNPRIP
jgi:hypothetical protein